jgi:hypothetical protein
MVLSENVTFFAHLGNLMGHFSTLENLWGYFKIGC